MKNMSSSKFFVCLVAGMVMATIFSCSFDAGGSASVELKGTVLKEDVLSIREDGLSITPYFNGTGKYLEVVGENSDYRSGFGFGAGTEMKSGTMITLSKGAQYIAFKVVDDDGEIHYASHEVVINKKAFGRFVTPFAFETGDELGDIVIRKDGDTLYYKKTPGTTIKYSFSSSKSVSGAPTSSTGTVLTPDSGYITAPTDNNKFLLLSVWTVGSDSTNDSPVTGWYEVGSVGAAVMPVCWYNGSSYSHGSNVSVPVGGKISFVVSASKAKALRADWSSTSAQPSDKSISAFKADQVLNGEIRLEITNSINAVGYLRCWAETLDGGYGDVFVLTVSPAQGSGTATGGAAQVSTTGTGYLFVNPSFAGTEVQITFEDRSGNPRHRGTIEATGKIPIAINRGEKISVSLIISGLWCDAKGTAGAWSQSSSWNNNQVILTSYSNEGKIPTGATETWTWTLQQ